MDERATKDLLSDIERDWLLLRAARVVCKMCEKRIPLVEDSHRIDKGLSEADQLTYGKYRYEPCQAVAIHALMNDVPFIRLKQIIHKAIGDCCFKDGTINSWLVSPSEAEKRILEQLGVNE